MGYVVDLLDEINMRLAEGYSFDKNEYMLNSEARIMEGETRNDDKDELRKLYQKLNE